MLQTGIDLSGDPVWDDRSESYWLTSYVNLTDHLVNERTRNRDNFSKYVNWFHAEESLILKPPYRAGSHKSFLVALLKEGHEEVSMTKEEMDKICCWIDIGIPHSGTYHEWRKDDVKQAMEEMLEKRRLSVEVDEASISEYLEDLGENPTGTSQRSDLYTRPDTSRPKPES